LHRQITGAFTPKNAVNVSSCSPVLIDDIAAIRNEPTFACEVTELVNRWKAISRCQFDDELAMGVGDEARQDDNSPVWFLRNISYRPLDLYSITYPSRR